MRAGPSRLAVTLALLFATAASPGTAASPAASPWSPSLAVSSVGLGVSSFAPNLVVGADGSALVSWSYRLGTGHMGQRAVQRSPDGSLEPEVELPWRSTAPLAYGANETVALLTPEARRIRIVSGSTNGVFGGARTILTGPPAGYRFARMAANDSGHVAVVQRSTQPNRDSRIMLIERRPGEAFGRPQLIRG